MTRSISGLFDNVADCLLEQAHGEDELGTIIEGMAARLKDGGLPISRISTGRTILHPLFGLIGTQWDSDSERQDHTRNIHRHPFGEMTLDAVGGKASLVADLTNPKEFARFAILTNSPEIA